jgi:hypothetical protein
MRMAGIVPGAAGPAGPVAQPAAALHNAPHAGRHRAAPGRLRGEVLYQDSAPPRRLQGSWRRCAQGGALVCLEERCHIRTACYIRDSAVALQELVQSETAPSWPPARSRMTPPGVLERSSAIYNIQGHYTRQYTIYRAIITGNKQYTGPLYKAVYCCQRIGNDEVENAAVISRQSLRLRCKARCAVEREVL